MGILALPFRKRRILNFDSAQIHVSAKTSGLLLIHLNMTKDFAGLDSSWKWNLPYYLLSHSDHPVTRAGPLQAVPGARSTGRARDRDRPRGRIHSSGTSEHRAVGRNCPGAFQCRHSWYFSWQHISQVSRDPVIFKGHLIPTVGKTNSCAAVLSCIPSPLWVVPVLAQVWNLSLMFWCESRNWNKLWMLRGIATVCQFARLLWPTSAFPSNRVIAFR